ncbi:MAG: response regulator transcription factor [candidate division Zixibacteria bacterium]|nr:response regulator transcription factor [candidate division Zixibacteria bacterium]
MKNGTSTTRILLVEDDVKLSRLVTEFLERNDFDVAVEFRGDRAVDRIVQENPDLVILDIMLPGMDGFDICRRVRPQFRHPILILTARGDEADELVGLELGADDYMAKPVRPQLLLARIKTLLRRSQRYSSDTQQITVGAMEIDAAARSVQLDGQPVDLTSMEFDLLWLLANRPGEVVTRDQISHALQGREWDGLGRSIDLCISRLRRKLGDDGKKPEWIRSIRGTGYMLATES